MALDKNNHMLRSTGKMRTICEPLFRTTELNYFDIARFYNDGTVLTLTSKPDLIQYLEEEQMYCTSEELAQLHQHNFINQRIMSPAFRNPKYMKFANDLEERINMVQSFSIVNWYETYIEAFFLSSASTDIDKVMDFYMNGSEVIEKFITYFKHQAHDLIQEAEQVSNRLVVPSVKDCLYSQELRPIIQDFPDERFLYDPQQQAFSLVGTNGKVTLTPREVQCLTYISKGRTAKEIGKILDISYRTVEKHISNAKEKLGCSFKAQLINIFLFNQSLIVKKNVATKSATFG